MFIQETTSLQTLIILTRQRRKEEEEEEEEHHSIQQFMKRFQRTTRKMFLRLKK